MAVRRLNYRTLVARSSSQQKSGELIQLPKQKRQRRYSTVGGKLLLQSCPPATIPNFSDVVGCLKLQKT